MSHAGTGGWHSHPAVLIHVVSRFRAWLSSDVVGNPHVHAREGSGARCRRMGPRSLAFWAALGFRQRRSPGVLARTLPWPEGPSPARDQGSKRCTLRHLIWAADPCPRPKNLINLEQLDSPLFIHSPFIAHFYVENDIRFLDQGPVLDSGRRLAGPGPSFGIPIAAQL